VTVGDTLKVHAKKKIEISIGEEITLPVVTSTINQDHQERQYGPKASK
jgi:hypothetical protein